MCMLFAHSVPHPVPVAQAVVTTLLVISFAAWMHVKPAAVRMFRVPAALAAMSTCLAMLVGGLGFVVDERPPCMLALQASMVLTACVIAEIVAHVTRERIPRAVASLPD